MITVQVKKNQLTVVKTKLEPMTSGSQNVYPIQFLFSPEWRYLEKVAVFATDMTKDGPKDNPTYNQLLDENGRCMIPWEVNLVHSNHVFVGVYGVMNEEVVLPTIWADIGNVSLGVMTGIDAEPPTPDIHHQILAKLGEIRGTVDAFIKSGLRVIKGEIIDNRDAFPEELPRAYIMNESSIATNAGEMSMSWPFLNEPVYVRDKAYIDEYQNEKPAIYVTDMLNKTYAFLYDGTGAFTDMIPVNDPPVNWDDVVNKPDFTDVTRTRFATVTLFANRWDEEGNQSVVIPSINADPKAQLIFPIPTDESYDLYYEKDIKVIKQNSEELIFHTNDKPPEENCTVNVYILNAVNLPWKPAVDDEDGCCCVDYDFMDGLTEEEVDPKKVLVKVDTVDDFTGDNEKLPMSMGGVRTIVGDIDRLLDEI